MKMQDIYTAINRASEVIIMQDIYTAINRASEVIIMHPPYAYLTNHMKQNAS